MEVLNEYEANGLACQSLPSAGFLDPTGCSSDPVPTDTPVSSPTPGVSPTPTQPTPSLTPAPIDQDQDGFTVSDGDCNDEDDSIYPGAAETPYDDVDQDCDGQDLNDLDQDGFVGTEAGGKDCDDATDDADSSITGQSTFYADADNDGYGNASSTKKACSKPTGYVTDSTDCNDANANVNPGKAEVSGNSIDDNCNGQVDEVAACSSYTDKKAAALAACKAKFATCVDTGSMSYIG